jgi:ferric enterobactin receptor
MFIKKSSFPKLTLSTFFFLLSLAISAQTEGVIKGQILDSISKSPMSFAAVQVMDSRTDKFVKGNTSSEDGKFSIEVPTGKYYVVIDFLGYKKHRTPSFSLTDRNLQHDLGVIGMNSSAETLKEVVVQGEKSTMELTLDKKVFNVGKDLGNAGGTASDILSNIPSVSVDGEGNVKLRGSDNVRILIDGKPSGLVSIKGGSGLQQLQGSQIEKVEIITNPSARYEAEGMSGVINIVLKKERKEGFNGSFELITGNPANFGAAANVNFRHRKVNFFINYGIAYRIQPGESKLSQEVFSSDSILRQTNKFTITGFNNNIRGGVDYFINDKNTLTASYLFRRSDANRISKNHYEDYLNSTENLIGVTNRKQDEDEAEPNSEYAVSYKKVFSKEGHELLADFRFLDNWERSDQTFTQSKFTPENPIPVEAPVQHSLNDEFEKQYLFQIDYIHPFAKYGKIEGGLRSSLRDMVNDYFVKEQNEEGEWVSLPNLDNYFIYDENIHALYGIYGNKINKVSYQIGLRGEMTDVKTTLRETNEVNPRKYSNLFPSAHFTYDLPKKNAVQVSYSRRVRRPRYNDLSPFMTFSDNRNYFSGNPNLNPEFSDAFELGHIKYFDQGSLTSSLYYRYIKGKIESIRSVNDQGFSTTMPMNLNLQHAFGAEFTSSYSLYKWWKQDLNLNFFRAITDGSNIDNRYTSNTYSWFARLTSKFSLPENIDFQLRGNYEAPQKTAQGRRKSMAYLDISASKDIFKNNGTITLNVQDLFNSRRYRAVTEGDNFYTNSNGLFRKRQINLTLSYRLNQSKQAEKRKNRLDAEEGGQ